MNIYITRRIKIYESFSKFDFSPNYRLKNLFTKTIYFFYSKGHKRIDPSIVPIFRDSKDADKGVEANVGEIVQRSSKQRKF